MKLQINEQEYQISEEALSSAVGKAKDKFAGIYAGIPLDQKILLKGMCRTFLMYLQSKYHNDLFKGDGDPTLQIVSILGLLLTDTLKDATINTVISNDTIDLKSIELESEGKSW